MLFVFHPILYNSFYERGIQAKHLNKYSDMKKYFQTAHSIVPSAKALYFQGMSEYMSKNTSQAAMLFQNSLEKGLYFEDLFTYIALCQDAIQNNARKKYYLYKALAMDRNNMIANFNMAAHYTKNFKPEIANKFLKRPVFFSKVSEPKKYSSVLYMVAYNYYFLKDYERAALYLKKYLSINLQREFQLYTGADTL